MRAERDWPRLRVSLGAGCHAARRPDAKPFPAAVERAGSGRSGSVGGLPGRQLVLPRAAALHPVHQQAVGLPGRPNTRWRGAGRCGAAARADLLAKPLAGASCRR